MSMNVVGFTIDHDAGSTWDDNDVHQETAEEAEQRRAEQRMAAIEQFRDTAAKDTIGKLHQILDTMIGMAISLRGVNRSASGTGIGAKMRECADFLEDI